MNVRSLSVSMVAVLFVGTAWAAINPVVDLSRASVAEISQLTAGPIKPGTIIKVPAGYHLPVELSARGDVVVTRPTTQPITLVARRDLYLKFANDNVLVSLDGQTYRPVAELFTGSATLSLSADDHGQKLRAKAEMEMRVRGEQ